ncbi:hypothetical protein PIB30_017562 [Stylosanthes scabra]|uniref:Senescence regulator n=1 Tax=Stylosanthes scabra TaxID=79078 RepID=A0ABU6T8G9_9FABA|nr:hypothetical protein [Stylosanthes scabra]
MADFGEEDVWGSINKEKDHHHHGHGYDPDSGSSRTMMMRVSSKDSSSAWPIPAAPRKIPRANTTLPPSFSSSSSYGNDEYAKLEGSSSNSSSSAEPMNIPDWSKIYGKNNSKKKGYDHSHHENGDGDDGDDDDDDGEMVPPHEWIARRQARRQISSFSMCEGMGRTLKGRDLSKVRNAILTKTGFIE